MGGAEHGRGGEGPAAVCPAGKRGSPSPLGSAESRRFPWQITETIKVQNSISVRMSSFSGTCLFQQVFIPLSPSQDPGIAKFALVSESDIPVQNFDCAHKMMTEKKRSFVKVTLCRPPHLAHTRARSVAACGFGPPVPHRLTVLSSHGRCLCPACSACSAPSSSHPRGSFPSDAVMWLAERCDPGADAPQDEKYHSPEDVAKRQPMVRPQQGTRRAGCGRPRFLDVVPPFLHCLLPHALHCRRELYPYPSRTPQGRIPTPLILPAFPFPSVPLLPFPVSFPHSCALASARRTWPSIFLCRNPAPLLGPLLSPPILLSSLTPLYLCLCVPW